jgi:anti-sigma-K factor RskA
MAATHSHISELIPGFVLGCLDQDDLIIVSEHIVDCAECQEEIQIYQAIADQLAMAGPLVSPAADLKDRLMTRIQASSPQRLPSTQPIATFIQRTMLVWAIIALLIILGLGTNSWLLWQRVNQLEAVLEQRTSNLQAINLMSATKMAPDATGVIILSSNGWQGTLVVDHLPVLDEKYQYQLWLIKNDDRDSGATFSVDKYGYSAVWISPPQPLESYSSFGVSIEPAGGSANPTGEKILGGNFN